MCGPVLKLRFPNASYYEWFEQEVVRVVPKAVGSSQRRSLTSKEARELLRIMRARGIKQKHVMDELGLKRMNPSIWLSCRGGTKVDPEVIMRLERWLQSNAAAPS